MLDVYNMIDYVGWIVFEIDLSFEIVLRLSIFPQGIGIDSVVESF